MDSILIWSTLKVSLLGSIVYLSHGYLINSYLRNQNTLLTAFMLPPVALVITTAIATNFFLSLGMIGALSIIRYRTPVKSQYELGLLFALITIGVVGGVNMSSAIWISLFLTMIAPCYWLISRFLPSKVLAPHGNNVEKESHKLITTLNGTLDENISITNGKGKLISADTIRSDSGSETSVHLQFNSMKECIEAQSEIQKTNNVISISVS